MDEFDDRFAPLTEDELAAAQAGDDAPKDEGECIGECIMPVPANAPAKPDAHPGLGKPSCRWPYRYAAGRLLFEVWRFDPAGKRKIFLPLSLWRDASGALRWLWKSVPAPRPLYGLDKLAANSDAPVVFCEGEKAADAGARDGSRSWNRILDFRDRPTHDRFQQTITPIAIEAYEQSQARGAV